MIEIKNERYCLCCNSGDIEDEFHFICRICSCFDNLRKQYLKKYNHQRPSMFKFLDLLNTQNKTTLFKITRHIKEALELRKTILNCKHTVHPQFIYNSITTIYIVLQILT